MLGFLLALVTNPTVIAIATASAAWLWHKARGDQQQSLKDLATGFARQAVAELVDQPDAQSKAAAYIEQKILDGATKLGIPAAALEAAKPLIDPVVQHAVADLLVEIKNRTNAAKHISDQMAALATRLATFNDDFAKAAAAGHAQGAAIFAETAERVDDPAPSSSSPAPAGTAP